MLKRTLLKDQTRSFNISFHQWLLMTFFYLLSSKRVNHGLIGCSKHTNIMGNLKKRKQIKFCGLYSFGRNSWGISVLGITIRWERTFRIIFQLNNLYFLPWCTLSLSHFGMRCAYGFCMYEKIRGREPGAGQPVARDQTPQPNNIHNIHQICIYYLRGVLSILQMCMCVWKGPACTFSILRILW